MNNPGAVWVILQGVRDRFVKPDGADYFQYVVFYDNSPTPWEYVSLDGDFSAEQLRRIADAMDTAMHIGETG